MTDLSTAGMVDFANIFAALPHAYVVIAPDLTVLAASSRYLELTMTTRDRLIGHRLFDVFPDDPEGDHDGFAQARTSIEAALASAAPHRLPMQKVDLRRSTASGGGFEERYWDITHQPVQDAAGQVVCVVQSCHDITEDVRRARADAERLATAQERFEVTFEQSAVGIAHVGLGGRFRRTNAKLRNLLGFSVDDMSRKRLGELTHPDDRAASERHVAALLQGEIPHYTTDKRLLKQDGSLLWASVTRSLIRTAAGEPDYFVVVVEEISALKEAVAALQEQEASLRSILDTVPDAMVVIDGRGTIESFSKAAEQVFGYSAAEAVGRNVNILMPAPERDSHNGYLRRHQSTGARRIIGVGRVVLGERKDGSTFPLSLTVGEITGRNRFVGFIQDMTEHQRTEASLREMQAELVHMSRFTALGEMASALAHELNQPLTAIANYLKGGRRLLDQGMGSTPLLRQAIDEAADQSLRAGQIIRRLRDFVARGESERHAEALPKLIDEACALSLIGTKESGVRVRFDLDPLATLVYADRIQVQQVLVNLIRNAVEAMQGVPTRVLTVTTLAGPAEVVEIAVADTGPGLHPDVAAQLFQPFVTTKVSGMGVGLSICRTIIEAHEGRIWAGAAPGGGTVFRFTLRSLRAGADSSE